MMGYIDKPVQFKRAKRLKIIDYKTNAKPFAPDEIDYNPHIRLFTSREKSLVKVN